MPTCLVCGEENPDYAKICSKCHRCLPCTSEKTYALREFLLKDQKLFLLLGVFLAIALFFNTAQFFIFTSSSSDDSNYIGQTNCEKQSFKINCIGNFSSSNESNTTIKNDANNSFYFDCERQLLELNCSSAISIKKNPDSNPIPDFSKSIKAIAFLCLFPFLVIAGVILRDSFLYIGRFTEHLKIYGLDKGIFEVLKDVTIFLFIVPFIFIVFYFAFLILAVAFSDYYYLNIGYLVAKTIGYCAYLLVLLYILAKTWGMIIEKPHLEIYVVPGYVIMGFVSLVIGVMINTDFKLDLIVLGVLLIVFAIGIILSLRVPKIQKKLKINE